MLHIVSLHAATERTKLEKTHYLFRTFWLAFSSFFFSLYEADSCIYMKVKGGKTENSHLYFPLASHSSCMKSCLHKCHPSEFLPAVFFGNAIVLIFIHSS